MDIPPKTAENLNPHAHSVPYHIHTHHVPARMTKQKPNVQTATGAHSAAYRQCPNYQTTAKTLEVRAKEGITYKQALEKVKNDLSTTITSTNNTQPSTNNLSSNLTNLKAETTELQQTITHTDYISTLTFLLGKLTAAVINLVHTLPKVDNIQQVEQQVRQIFNIYQQSAITNLLAQTNLSPIHSTSPSTPHAHPVSQHV